MGEAFDLVREHLVEARVPAALIEPAMAQWHLVPFHVEGELAAVAMVAGPEVHLVLAPARRGTGALTRARLRAGLAPLLERHGFLTTRTAKGDGAQRLFIDRLGFKWTWSDEQFSYFMLTELPFGKGK